MKSLKTSVDEGTVGLCPKEVNNKKLAEAVFSKAKLDPATGCWIWQPKARQRDYGIFHFRAERWRAHRAAYAAVFGLIPEGQFVCHKCDRPLCVNPSHLFLGTAADNFHDSVNKGRNKAGVLGSLNLRAKLTEPVVLDIRREVAAGGGMSEIAARLSLGRSTIRNVVYRKTWAWLP